MTNRSTDKKIFTNETIRKVWEKAEIVTGLDCGIYRKDKCGAMIKMNLYGQSNVKFSMAWEIDHIKPEVEGGTDDLINLQALQWENNRNKENHYPSWSCLISSDKNQNKLIVR